MKKDLPWYEGQYIVKTLNWGAVGDCGQSKNKLIGCYGITTIKDVQILYLNYEEVLMQDKDGAYILLPMKLILSIAPIKRAKKKEEENEES
jgi:hypothetical protein